MSIWPDRVQTRGIQDSCEVSMDCSAARDRCHNMAPATILAFIALAFCVPHLGCVCAPDLKVSLLYFS